MYTNCCWLYQFFWERRIKMWFKQAQLFKLENSFGALELEGYLEQLLYSLSLRPSDQPGLDIANRWRSCLISIYSKRIFTGLSANWSQLLPAKILRQKLNEKVKEIQLAQDRKVSYKEKNSIKQEVYNELLQRHLESSIVTMPLLI